MINTKKTNIIEFFEEAKNSVAISEDRRQLLINIADKIIEEYKKKGFLNLNFICTHNSRRSQMGQVWAFFAAEYFTIKDIRSFSGGTEVTAFHRNTVKCLQKVGFEFSVLDFSHQNPKYLITFNGTEKSMIGFSKTYDEKINELPYIAITTCDSADQNCPFIPDAIYRFHLPYTDPKNFENTEFQQEKYLETCKKIAAEIFTIFKIVKENI